MQEKSGRDLDKAGLLLLSLLRIPINTRPGLSLASVVNPRMTQHLASLQTSLETISLVTPLPATMFDDADLTLLEEDDPEAELTASLDHYDEKPGRRA